VEFSFVDHDDSFSDNLIDLIACADPKVRVHRYDAATTDLELALRPTIFSPGPGNPTQMIRSQRLLSSIWGKVPVLGVCLGHQLIGIRLGYAIVADPHAHHGSTRTIKCLQRDHTIAANLPESFSAASYNSLMVAGVGTEHLLAVDEFACAQMIYANVNGMPVYGMQFHPESFMTEIGSMLMKAWIAGALKRQRL
jgi:anthranilate synthase component 2